MSFLEIAKRKCATWRAEVGITEALFGKSPEEKVAIVSGKQKAHPRYSSGMVLMTPPRCRRPPWASHLARTATLPLKPPDAVVLETSLGKVDELIHIGRRMRKIALQSAVGGMGLSMVGMVIAAGGYLPPVAGAITQELIDVAAVLKCASRGRCQRRFSGMRVSEKPTFALLLSYDRNDDNSPMQIARRRLWPKPERQGLVSRGHRAPDEPAVQTKAKNQNIRVSPAVLDAARKDGEELLQSLRTAAAG